MNNLSPKFKKYLWGLLFIAVGGSIAATAYSANVLLTILGILIFIIGLSKIN